MSGCVNHHVSASIHSEAQGLGCSGGDVPPHHRVFPPGTHSRGQMRTRASPRGGHERDPASVGLRGLPQLSSASAQCAPRLLLRDSRSASCRHEGGGNSGARFGSSSATESSERRHCWINTLRMIAEVKSHEVEHVEAQQVATESMLRNIVQEEAAGTAPAERLGPSARQSRRGPRSHRRLPSWSVRPHTRRRLTRRMWWFWRHNLR